MFLPADKNILITVLVIFSVCITATSEVSAQIYNPLNPASPAQITPGTTSPLPNTYQVPRFSQSNPNISSPYVFPGANTQNPYSFNPTLTVPNVLSPVSPVTPPGATLPNAGALNPSMGVLNSNIKVTNPSLNIPNLSQPQSSSTNIPTTGTYNPIPGIQLPQPQNITPNTIPSPTY